MARAVAQKHKTVSKAPAGLDRLSQQAAAWLLGITPRALRIRQDLPRNADGSYDGAAVVAAYSEARCKAAAESALRTAAAGSDALERLRAAKAGLAELELQRQRHSLVRRDRMRHGLGRMADILREAGIELQRLYGREAYELITEALDDFEAQLDDVFPNDEEETTV